MKLILCNDDFGVSYGLTDAVAECHRRGLTTCTAVRVDGIAFEYAVADVWPRIPALELGLHLNLTEGRPVASPDQVPELVDDRGLFRRSFVDWLQEARPRAQTGRFQILLEQVEIEFRAQFERFLKWVQIPAFVNGNQHIHMIPGIFALVCRLTREYGGRYVRWPHEPFFLPRQWADYAHSLRSLNPLKHMLLKALGQAARDLVERHDLAVVDAFVGVLNTGRMNPALLATAIESMRRRGVRTTEVLFHPAEIEHEADRKHRDSIPPYYFSPDRAYEREQLLSAELKQILSQEQIELTTHQELADEV